MPPPDRSAFPEGFVWGTATSAHQVEGGNWNTDWWAWEHESGSPCVEPSGDACNHYELYAHDIDLLASLGFGAYRLSIEWARIEPEEGEYSAAQLGHYRRVLGACRERGLEPYVTFHHFTSPRWVAAAGGWTEPATADRFGRFCGRATAALGDLMAGACTLNEPNIVARIGYEVGTFPPGHNDAGAADRASQTFVAAHRRAVEAIKSGPGDAPVGMTLAMTDYQALDGGQTELERLRRRREDIFLEAARGDDFFGVQTYTRARVGPDGEIEPDEGAERTLMGYEFYPEALEGTIRRAWDVTENVPILVTENGVAVADDDDDRRIAYVERALTGVQRCMADGIDVRGYFYWSALDNFEWALGYRPTFGLIAVDRATQQRFPKPSARWLGGYIRSA
ncbi:family 1 glycosylhydrolase [soil metagenome]